MQEARRWLPGQRIVQTSMNEQRQGFNQKVRMRAPHLTAYTDRLCLKNLGLCTVNSHV